MGRATADGWLDRSFTHLGARVRLQLRCGAAPIMERVGASAKIARNQRTCRICNQAVVEDPEHLVSRCSHYAGLREECLQRITGHINGVNAPRLRQAIAAVDPALFLGDRLFSELSPETAKAVDSVICDYLKLAWRKRAELWQLQCLPGQLWRLK